MQSVIQKPKIFDFLHIVYDWDLNGNHKGHEDSVNRVVRITSVNKHQYSNY